MTKQELKEAIYEEFKCGQSVKDVIKKYKGMHTKIENVVGGCWVYYNSNLDRFVDKPKENVYKAELEHSLVDMVKALETLYAFSTQSDNIEQKVNTIDYLQQSILHRIESEETEEGLLKLTISLAGLRAKRRMLKKELDIKGKFESHLKVMTTPKSLGTAYTRFNKELEDVKGFNHLTIAKNYDKTLEHKLDNKQKDYLEELRKEFEI